MTCPACGSDSTMVMANNHGLCFECGCDWQPDRIAEVLAARNAPPLEPFQMATVEEVFGPPQTVEAIDQSFVEELQTFTDDLNAEADAFDPQELVGQLATLEGGQVAMILSIEDDDHIGVELTTGEAVVVNFSDVEGIRPLPPIETIIEEATAGDPQEETT